MAEHSQKTVFPLPIKLITGFLLVTVPSLVAIVAISLYATWELRTTNHELQEISRSLEAVQGLETTVERTVTQLSAYLVDGAQGHESQFKALILDVEERMKTCGSAACHTTSGQAGAMAESLAPYIRKVRDQGVAIFAGAPQGTETDKLRVLYEINQQGDEANRRLERMATTLLQRVTTLQEKSLLVSQRASTRIIVTATLVLALAALGAWLLSRKLLGHVDALLTGTRKIIQGDLDYRVAVAQQDEIGQLAASFNAMAQKLQEQRENLESTVESRTAELRQARDSLLQSEKLASIGLLAAGVAHELNNPLTSILMNVNLLMEDAGDDTGLRAELQRISEDTVRCKWIIDDLLDFSRKQELDIAPTDLNALIRTALEQLGRGTGLQGIDIVTALASGLPPLPCDAARMEQVLANTLVNAVQAMPKGGTLTVHSTLRPDYAVITVSDTGTGIPKEIRSRIFDPFFTTKTHGTGLGLSIVFRIMEAHGGKVEVQNIRPGRPPEETAGDSGTRILLLLPLTGVREHDDATDNNATDPA